MENSQENTNMRLFGIPASDVYAEARNIAETDLRGKINELNLAMMLVKDARVSMEAALVKITAAHVNLVLERGESLDDEIHTSFINNLGDEMWEATENVENYDVYSPSEFFHVYKPSFEAEENENNYEEFASEEGVERTAEVAATQVKETFGKSRVAGETAEEADCEAIKEEIKAEEYPKSPFKFGEVRTPRISKVSSEHASRSLESTENERVAEYVVNESVVGVQEVIKLVSKGGEAVKIINASIALPRGIDEYKSYGIGDAVLLKKLDKPPNTSVKGDVFQSMPGVEQLSGSLRQVKDFIKFKVPGPAHIKNGVGDSYLFKQYDYVVKNYEDSGPRTKYNRIKMLGAICREEKHGAFNREKLNFLFKHMDDRFKLEQLVAEMSQMEEPDGLMLIEHADCINRYKANEHKYSVEYKSLGPAYVRKNVKVSARSVTHNPREKLFSNMSQSKGFIRLNIPFNHVDNKLKLERKLFDNTIPSKGFAILKLGTAYARRRSGSTVLVIKSEFIKRGIGGCNPFEQYVYVVRSYEDAGLLAKYSRIKASGTVCLEEKHRAFIREELNIILKYTDYKPKLEWQASNLQQARIIAKLKFTGTTNVERFIGGFGLIAKPAHVIKDSRPKEKYKHLILIDGEENFQK